MGISFQKPASQQIPLLVERPLSLDHQGGVPGVGISAITPADKSASLRKAETVTAAKAVVLRACPPPAGLSAAGGIRLCGFLKRDPHGPTIDDFFQRAKMLPDNKHLGWHNSCMLPVDITSLSLPLAKILPVFWQGGGGVGGRMGRREQAME